MHDFVCRTLDERRVRRESCAGSSKPRNAALRDRLRLSVDRETEAAAKLREATRENARLQKDAKSANNYKNRAKKATARADELDRVLASVLAHSQHLEAELATLRSMPRLLVRNTTAPPVTPGDGDSAY